MGRNWLSAKLASDSVLISVFIFFIMYLDVIYWGNAQLCYGWPDSFVRVGASVSFSVWTSCFDPCKRFCEFLQLNLLQPVALLFLPVNCCVSSCHHCGAAAGHRQGPTQEFCLLSCYRPTLMRFAGMCVV